MAKERKQRIKRTYVDGEGVVTGHPTEGVQVVRHVHLDDDGEEVGAVEVDLTKLIQPLVVRHAAFGVNTRIGNAGNTAKSVTPIEAAESLAEQILAGEWGSEREPGLAPSIFFEALVRAMADAEREFDLDAFKNKLTEMAEDARTEHVAGISKGAKVAYQIAQVKAERAAERMKKLEKAAGEAEEDELDNI